MVPAGCASPPALSRSPAAATHSARRMGSSTMRSTRWSSSSTADHSAPSSLKGSTRMKPTRLTCSSSAQAQWVAAALGLQLQAAASWDCPHQACSLTSRLPRSCCQGGVCLAPLV